MIAADSPWLTALPPFLVASAVCIAAVPGSIWLARRTGAVAEPDGDRHLHRQATPRLGGIAMFAGFAVAIAIFGSSINDRWQVLAVTAAITAAMAVDDVLDLSWRSKLGIEVGVGVLAVLLGITITTIAVPGAHSPSVIDLLWLSAPVTVVWLVGMQVSVNLLDGADGVAAGVIAIVAAVCLLAAISRIGPPDHEAQIQTGVVILSGAVMGCCLGFLVFNLPPARVFMGDSGAISSASPSRSSPSLVSPKSSSASRSWCRSSRSACRSATRCSRSFGARSPGGILRRRTPDTSTTAYARSG